MDRIRDTISKKEIDDLLKTFIDRKSPSYKKRYTGIVEDNNDPDKKGRCRIRVYGIFGNEIPKEDLPWASQEQTFLGSNLGNIVIPKIGSLVRVYFDDDEIYKPVYTTKVPVNGSISSEANEDYPNSMVFFETDEGEFFKINRSSMETTYRHSTGVQIVIDGSGNITIDNSTVQGDGNINFKSLGDITLESTTGSVNIQAELGYVNLGKNAAISANNYPVDPITNAPHAIGGQTQGVPGSVRLKA